jgi:hypothetical protein
MKEAQSPETIANLKYLATKDGAADRDKYYYARYLIEKKEKETNDIDDAVRMLSELASGNGPYKSKACLEIGFLYAVHNPKTAVQYLQMIKYDKELFGEACQLLACIYQSSKDVLNGKGNEIKAFAYYPFADNLDSKLRAISSIKATYDPFVKRIEKTLEKGDADFIYKLVRCRYEEGLISAATYTANLLWLTGHINFNKKEDENTLKRLNSKILFQRIKSGLIQAKKEASLAIFLEYLKQVKKTADYIAKTYEGTPKATRANKLTALIDDFLLGQRAKTSYWKTLKAEAAANIKFYGEITKFIGTILGTGVDIFFGLAPKGIDILIFDDKAPELFSLDRGFGRLGGVCLGFIGKALGAVIGLLASVAYPIRAMSGSIIPLIPPAEMTKFVDDCLAYEDSSLLKVNSGKQKLFNSSTYANLPLADTYYDGNKKGKNKTSETTEQISPVHPSPLGNRINTKNLYGTDAEREWLVPEAEPKLDMDVYASLTRS